MPWPRRLEPEQSGLLDHLDQPQVRLQQSEVRRGPPLRLDAVDELADGALFDGVLAECRQDVGDVLHEDAVRPDHEHASMLQRLPLRVEEPRSPMEPDGCLAGTGAALDHERDIGVVCDQAVLVGLDRGDDVAHVHVTVTLELFEQEVADRCPVDDRTVERLVGDVEQAPPIGPEATPESHAVRILGRRRVERPRCRRLPVDHDLTLLLVVDPAAADVERPRQRLEVESAEAKPPVGILERAQALCRPGVHRRLRDLAVDLVAGGGDDVAHPLEMLVRAVDVGLLGAQLRVAHETKLPRDLPPLILRRLSVDRREFALLAAAAPFGLRAALASAPSALVTCDAEARLAVVDLGSYRVVRSIATLPDPRSVELVGERAVVCHTAMGAVSILDRLGVRHVLRGLGEPRYTAAHPDGRHAFVTDSGRSGVVAVDVLRGVEVGRVRLPGWARHLTIDRNGGRLWVALGTAAEHLALVDVDSLRHVSTLTPGFAAHDVGRAPDARLWVTSGSSRELAVGGAVSAADLAPQHVTFGRGVAYVTSGDSGTLHVQDLDGRILRRSAVPTGSYNVQFGFGRVLTASLSRGTLAVLDRRGAPLHVVRVAGSCHDACFLPG